MEDLYIISYGSPSFNRNISSDFEKDLVKAKLTSNFLILIV